MKNKTFLLIVLVKLIAIESATAKCPSEITHDQLVSLRKGQQIAHDGASYVLESFSPIKANILEDEVLSLKEESAQPPSCLYRDWSDNLTLKLKQK